MYKSSFTVQVSTYLWCKFILFHASLVFPVRKLSFSVCKSCFSVHSFLCPVLCSYASVDALCDVYFEEEHVAVIYVNDPFSIRGCNGKKQNIEINPCL